VYVCVVRQQEVMQHEHLYEIPLSPPFCNQNGGVWFQNVFSSTWHLHHLYRSSCHPDKKVKLHIVQVLKMSCWGSDCKCKFRSHTGLTKIIIICYYLYVKVYFDQISVAGSLTICFLFYSLYTDVSQPKSHKWFIWVTNIINYNYCVYYFLALKCSIVLW